MSPTESPDHAAADAAVPPLLARVQAPDALRAAVLALLVPPGSRRPAAAWEAETAGCDAAPALRDEVTALPRHARLPWLERLLVRMALLPLVERQRLLEASRRLMNVRGAALPIDTLHWLVMRQRFGERGSLSARGAAETTFTQMPENDVHAIARFSAFLARLVPGGSALAPAHAAWYRDVMSPWAVRVPIPPCDPPPDADELVQSLRDLQALPWMQRPMIVRQWVSAAFAHTPPTRLDDGAADALRMSCTLLDSPMPPELTAHYIVAPAAGSTSH